MGRQKAPLFFARENRKLCDSRIFVWRIEKIKVLCYHKIKAMHFKKVFFTQIYSLRNLAAPF